MASILGPNTTTASELASRSYAPLTIAVLLVVGILALYASTVASMVGIWQRSETFAHGFVVVPICLWLAWRHRAVLAATPARPWWPALLLVALAGALWLAASLADVVSGRQFALVLMVQAGLVALLGLAVARAAAFPLAFLLFAVPAGEFLLPTLIDWTADFTVAALRLSGVPVYREANQFVIPSGQWSVVEACSGLRYLIASLMIGTLYAAVSFRSPWRRAAFVAASLLVPILANWIRAYLIVMIGHLSDNRLAVGVDHLIYGWLFFGLVMGLLFWVGSLWSEPRAPAAPAAPASPAHISGASAAGLLGMAVAVLAVAGIWRPVLSGFLAESPLPVPELAALRITPGLLTGGAETLPEWTPAYSGQSAVLRQAFLAGSGAPVGLYVGFWRNQVKGRELVTSGNELTSTRLQQWIETSREAARVRFGGGDVDALRAGIAGQRSRFVVYRLFWVDGRVTGNPYVVKAWLAWSRLTGRPGDAALIVTYASAGAPGDPAREAMQVLSGPILEVLDRAGSFR